MEKIPDQTENTSYPEGDFAQRHPVEDLLQSLAKIEAELERTRVNRCVVFVDLCGYTAFVGDFGDVAGRLRVQRTESIVRRVTGSHNGRILKGLGDGWLLIFGDPQQALQASIELQRAIFEDQQDEPNPIQIKVALAHGRILEERNDVYGDVVNICSRLVDRCPPGEILLSESTFGTLDPYYRQRCEPLPQLVLRGKEHPVVGYRLVWRTEAPISIPVPDDKVLIEILWGENESRVSFRHSGDSEVPLISYEVHPLDLDRIETISKQIVEIIRQTNLRGVEVPTGSILERVGGELFALLFPPSIQTRIRASTADFLVLSLDDSCVHIPWELAHDGRDFLGCRFCLGRNARTRQSMPQNRRPFPEERVSFLVVSDPCGNLSEAAQEGQELYALCRSDSRVQFEMLNHAVESAEVTARLPQADMVHYCGHAEFVEDNLDDSGWVLADQRFTATHLRCLVQEGNKLPLVVFNNACHGGSTGNWKSNPLGWSYGFANAFLLAGSTHYIGAVSELLEESSRKFAAHFYSKIIAGFPVGLALREARRAMRVSNTSCLTWAQYVLYGDPATGVFRAVRSSQPVQSGAEPSSSPETTADPHVEELQVVGAGNVNRPAFHRRVGAGSAVAALFLVGAFLAWKVFFPPGNPAEVDQVLLSILRGTGTSAVAGEWTSVRDKADPSTQRTVRALAEWEEGKQSEARDEVYKILKEEPGHPLASLVLAQFEWMDKQRDQSEKTATALLDNPRASDWQKAEAWRLIGRLAAENGDTQKAAESYDRATGLLRQDGWIYVEKAKALEQMGQWEAAAAAYAQATTLEPENPVFATLYRTSEEKQTKLRDVEWMEQTRKLIEEVVEFRKHNQRSAPEDRWTSKPAAVAVLDLEEKGLPSRNLGENEVLLEMVAAELLKSQRVFLVDRARLDFILNEIGMSQQDIVDPSSAPEYGRLFAARFFVGGEVFRWPGRNIVSLKITNTENRDLNSGMPLTVTGELVAQSERIAAPIIEVLKEKYAIQGKIDSATEPMLLNIGSRHGVQLNQEFNVFPPPPVPSREHSITGLAPIGQVRVVEVGESDAAFELIQAASAPLTVGLRVREAE